MKYFAKIWSHCWKKFMLIGFKLVGRRMLWVLEIWRHPVPLWVMCWQVVNVENIKLSLSLSHGSAADKAEENFGELSKFNFLCSNPPLNFDICYFIHHRTFNWCLSWWHENMKVSHWQVFVTGSVVRTILLQLSQCIIISVWVWSQVSSAPVQSQLISAQCLHNTDDSYLSLLDNSHSSSF